MENEKHPVEQIAEMAGGTITSGGILPDGSGFATLSIPLPETHWLYRGDVKHEWGWSNIPPMPFRMGANEHAIFAPQREGFGVPPIMTRDEVAERIRSAGKYAVRCATLNGKDNDFDPDALIQNLVIGMLGYWTADGLSGESFGDPEDGGGENWKPEPRESGAENSALPEVLPTPVAVPPDFD